MLGRLFRHHSGRVYRFLGVALKPSRPDPVRCVVYQEMGSYEILTGKHIKHDNVWVRPETEWKKKFTLIEDEHVF